MMSIFEEVRSSFHVADVLTLLTGEIVESGGFACCPVCGSDRFQVTKSGTSWTCWAGSCEKQRAGIGGADACGLASAVWQVSRYDAAVRLVGDQPDRFHVETPKRVLSDSRGLSDDLMERADWQAWLEGIVKKSQEALFADDELGGQARDYLTGKRGLRLETAEAYGLGLNRHWVAFHDAQTGRKWSVAPGLLIPWTKPGGLAGVNVRELHESLPSKYLLATGSKRRWLWPGPWFNWDSVWSYKGPVLITEGELDAMAAQEALAGLVAVKTLGSATSGPAGLVESERCALADFTRLLVAADSDEAGRKCFDMWKRYNKRVQRLTLPEEFKDLGEAHAAGFDLREWFMSELERLGVGLSRDAGCGFDVVEESGSLADNANTGTVLNDFYKMP